MSEPTTLDGFLDNSFSVYQFKHGAHRSGLDAVLLAATVAVEETGPVADLGAGAGVVGMAVAQRSANTQVDLFEIDADTVALNRKSVALQQNAHLADRISTYCADVTKSGQLLKSAGRKPNAYTHICINPPFNDQSHRSSPGEKRETAHMMQDDDPENWIKTAATMCMPKGRLSLIIRPENLADFLPSVQRRFGSINLMALHAKPDRVAIRLLVGAIKGSRRQLHILPPLVLHEEDGSFTPGVEKIMRGRAGIELHS